MRLLLETSRWNIFLVKIQRQNKERKCVLHLFEIIFIIDTKLDKEDSQNTSSGSLRLGNCFNMEGSVK